MSLRSKQQDDTFVGEFLHVRLDREGGHLEVVRAVRHAYIICTRDVSAYMQHCNQVSHGKICPSSRQVASASNSNCLLMSSCYVVIPDTDALRLRL